MKKIIMLIFAMTVGVKAFAMYDFCESPADYNTFPQAYDVRTEYWTDIPNHHPDNIKFENMKNKNPIFPINIKKQKKTSDKTYSEKQ